MGKMHSLAGGRGAGWALTASVVVLVSVAVAAIWALAPPARAAVGRPVSWGHQSTAGNSGGCAKLLQTFDAPPPGFAPLLASNKTLRALGFPPKPPSTGPGARLAVAAWQNAMTHSRHYGGVPHPVCSAVRHGGPDYRIQHTTGNYAGFGTPYQYDGNESFTWAESQWVQPAVPGDSKYTNYQDAPDASFWTGTGGNYLIQAGADSIATATPEYRFWTEDYPLNTDWEGPTIRPGQTAYVYTDNEGGGECYYYLLNMTTDIYQSFTNSCPYDGKNVAFFIDERIENSSGTGYYLPNYDFASVSANSYGNVNSYNLSQDTDQYRMTSNCLDSGTLLSEPSTISDSSFIQYWDASSPFSDSC